MKENNRKELLHDLDETVLYEIFARLPQECLAELRYECKTFHHWTSWSKLVADSFHLSRPALLVQVPGNLKSRTFKTRLLELDREGLGFKNKKFGMSQMGKARSTCNGLLLVNDTNKGERLVVMNVLTKCYVTIPPCPSHCKHGACGLALVFNPREKVYKVLHVYNASFGFEIFTLGCSDNEWKVIPAPFSGPGEQPQLRWSDPLSTNGQLILHWDIGSREHIISFDTCEERFGTTCFPCRFQEGTGTLLEMGGNLSFIHRSSSARFDVWVLEDFESQVWSKSYSVLAESISYTSSQDTNALPCFENLVPLFSLRDGEIMLFRHKSSPCWYLYERKLRALKKLSGMPMKSSTTPKLLLYKSSLVRWKNKEELLVRETI